MRARRTPKTRTAHARYMFFLCMPDLRICCGLRYQFPQVLTPRHRSAEPSMVRVLAFALLSTLSTTVYGAVNEQCVGIRGSKAASNYEIKELPTLEDCQAHTHTHTHTHQVDNEKDTTRTSKLY
jgi:hypothetical protein